MCLRDCLWLQAQTSELSFPTDGKADLLNKLQANIVRSLLSNMHSVESDCPTRERVGWTGDSQATAETAVMSLDMRGFYAKWMQDYEDAQCPGKPGNSTTISELSIGNTTKCEIPPDFPEVSIERSGTIW